MSILHTEKECSTPHHERNAVHSAAKVVLEALVALLIIVLLCGGAYSAFTPLFFFFNCKIVKEDRFPSPNGRYEAVTFVKDCGGAASAFTPYVSILATGDKLHSYETGNVFVGSGGAYYIKVKWLTDTDLQVWYTLARDTLGRYAQPTRMLHEQNGITITYHLVETNGSP